MDYQLLPSTNIIVANEGYRFYRPIPIDERQNDGLWDVIGFALIESLRIRCNEACKRLFLNDINILIENSGEETEAVSLCREVIDVINEPFRSPTQKYLDATPELILKLKKFLKTLIKFNLSGKIFLMEKIESNEPLSCQEGAIFQHLSSKFKVEICIYNILSDKEYERFEYHSQVKGGIVDIFYYQNKSRPEVGLLLRDEHIEYYTTDSDVNLNLFPFRSAPGKTGLRRQLIQETTFYPPRLSCPLQFQTKIVQTEESLIPTSGVRGTHSHPSQMQSESPGVREPPRHPSQMQSQSIGVRALPSYQSQFETHSQLLREPPSSSSLHSAIPIPKNIETRKLHLAEYQPSSDYSQKPPTICKICNKPTDPRLIYEEVRCPSTNCQVCISCIFLHGIPINKCPQCKERTLSQYEMDILRIRYFCLRD